MGGHWNEITRTSSKCLACTSNYREEIEKRLNEGKAYTEIIKWVAKQKPTEDISRHTLKRHKTKHGFKMRVINKGEGEETTIDEEHLTSLNDFLDDVISKVHERVKSGALKPTITEGVKAAEIKGKIKEGSKWEKEVLKFFLGVSEKHGHSN